MNNIRTQIKNKKTPEISVKLNKSSRYQFSLALLEGTNHEKPSQNNQTS